MSRDPITICFGARPSASLRITVLPPWWQTWWFQTAVVLLIATAIYAGHRHRVKDLQFAAAKARATSPAKDARTGGGKRSGGVRKSCEEFLSCPHESRTAHTAERHSGVQRPTA